MTSTEIAVLNTGALVPTEVYAPGGVDKILDSLEAEVRATAKGLDISTPKGRKEIASLAYKVARSKTALDDMGKELVSSIKAQANAIDADRRTVRDRLDKLRDEVRKPLDDFEAAEAARVKAHEDGVKEIVAHANRAETYRSSLNSTALLERELADLLTRPTDGFQEFTKAAETAKSEAVARLTDLLEESRRLDAERAELERLRKEAAERADREEAERIEREKQEAAERAAAQAKAEAEEKARREAEEAERRAAAERERIEQEAREAAEVAERERQRVEREKAEAEERAAQAERDRQAAEQRAKEVEARAEQERIAAAEKAERDRIEAERRAEEERKAADERARQQAEEAARKERERIEAQRREEEEAARKREADKQHRASVNRGAVQALVAAGLPDVEAVKAVTAIAKGQVPAVRISY